MNVSAQLASLASAIGPGGDLRAGMGGRRVRLPPDHFLREHLGLDNAEIMVLHDHAKSEMVKAAEGQNDSQLLNQLPLCDHRWMRVSPAAPADLRANLPSGREHQRRSGAAWSAAAARHSVGHAGLAAHQLMTQASPDSHAARLWSDVVDMISEKVRHDSDAQWLVMMVMMCASLMLAEEDGFDVDGLRKLVDVALADDEPVGVD